MKRQSDGGTGAITVVEKENQRMISKQGQVG